VTDSRIVVEPARTAAQVVVPCSDLANTLEYLTSIPGFAVDLIMPADAPTVAVVSGHGVALRLEQINDDRTPPPITLRLSGASAPSPELRALAPGMRRNLIVEFVATDAPVDVPAGVQQFLLTRLEGAGSWGVGRAGMLYRDLIPGRLGGRFVASHIRIPQGGPVPDYVHFHRIRFQMIFCRRGSAQLVYEDQGPPFAFNEGDCVLQPPGIRHRVLETSAGFEVVEIGCPAVHETHADRALALPTGRVLPDRLFDSQRFVRHVAAEAHWAPWHPAGSGNGFEARDTGIGIATNGLAGVHVVRSTRDGAATPTTRHTGEFLFLFVLSGELKLSSSTLGDHRLGEADCCVIPAATDYALSADAGLDLLEVALP